MADDAHPGATVTTHIVTRRWRDAWRSPTQVRSARRHLKRLEGVHLAVCGPTSGGSGARRVNRTLSMRRMLVMVEWVSADAAARGRDAIDRHYEPTSAVWSATLASLQSKGTFNGVAAFTPTGLAEQEGVVASLTYAQVRPSKMWHFYVLGFPKTARRATGRDSTMIAGVGFGDVPVRHACTFTVWPSNADVVRFAYASSGVHGTVQARSREQRWLSESLFARFAVVDHRGSWSGTDPLAAATGAR